MKTTTLKRLAVAPLAWPAIGSAHTLTGSLPHSHDAATWVGFAAATALCWAAYRGALCLSTRRDATRRDATRRDATRPGSRRAGNR